jgi:hypothetical protein
MRNLILAAACTTLLPAVRLQHHPVLDLRTTQRLRSLNGIGFQGVALAAGMATIAECFY